MTLQACDLVGTRLKIVLVREAQGLFRMVEPANQRQGLVALLSILNAAWLELIAQQNLWLAGGSGVSVLFPSLMASGRTAGGYHQTH
jgi:hypothetical protein